MRIRRLGAVMDTLIRCTAEPRGIAPSPQSHQSAEKNIVFQGSRVSQRHPHHRRRELHATQFLVTITKFDLAAAAGRGENVLQRPGEGACPLGLSMRTFGIDLPLARAPSVLTTSQLGSKGCPIGNHN